MTFKRQVSVQFWLPLILLVVIPILLLNIITAQLLSSLKQDAAKAYLSDMDQAAYYLDEMLNESRALVRRLSANGEIQILSTLNRDIVLTDHMKIVRANTEREKLLSYETREYQFGMIFAENMFLLTSKGICYDLENFYGEVYQLGDLSYNQVEELITSGLISIEFYPQSTVLLDGKKQSGILYLDPITLQDNNCAFVLLDATNLERILKPLCTTDGFSYITDSEGKLLYQFGGKIDDFQYSDLPSSLEASHLSDKIYGDGFTMVHSSLLSGLHIVSVNPQLTAYKNVHFMQNMVWVLNIICIFFCVFMAWFLIFRRTEKLRKVLGFLMPSEKGGKKDIYSSLGENLTNLIDQNHTLSNTLSSQRPILKDMFWEQLLEGQVTQEEQLQNLAAKASLDLDGSNCLLVITVSPPSDSFTLLTVQETEKIRTELIKQLRTIPSVNDLVHEVGLQQIVVILKITAEHKKIYKEVVCNILESIDKSLTQPGVYIAIGVPVEGINTLYYQYTLCKNRINVSILEEQPLQGLIWCENDTPFKDVFYFPHELEMRLVSGIRSGDFLIVKDCFRSLLMGNFISRSISPIMNELLLNRMELMILSVYDERMEYTFEEISKRMKGIRTETVRMSYLLDICQKMCEFYKANSNVSPDTRQEIQEYIRTQMDNPALSLSGTADHFHFSESYFSRIFKGIIGETFSDYVERIRMEEADRLLTETELKVEEISQLVAYVNVSSFRRAYKRHIGIAPSQRREKKER